MCMSASVLFSLQLSLLTYEFDRIEVRICAYWSRHLADDQFVSITTNSIHSIFALIFIMPCVQFCVPYWIGVSLSLSCVALAGWLALPLSQSLDLCRSVFLFCFVFIFPCFIPIFKFEISIARERLHSKELQF